MAAAAATPCWPTAATTAWRPPTAKATVTYRAASGETNSLLVREIGTGRGLEFVDSTGLTSRSPLCAAVSGTTVRCALGFDRVDARLGDRDDSASIRVSGPVVIDGGDGQDLFFAGMAPGASRVDYRGGLRPDTISYASSSAGATMTQDDVANDGRPSRGDRDTVRRDVEHVIGSPFDDRIEASRTGLIQSFPSGNGASFPQQLTGGAGNDVVRGGTNMGFHFMGGGVDGRDTILGDGAVVVKRARIVTRGRTVVAKLALRLDESLAGQTLKAEVEATDRRGARQLERARQS